MMESRARAVIFFASCFSAISIRIDCKTVSSGNQDVAAAGCVKLTIEKLDCICKIHVVFDDDVPIVSYHGQCNKDNKVVCDNKPR